MTQVYLPNEIFKNILSYNDNSKSIREKKIKSINEAINLYGELNGGLSLRKMYFDTRENGEIIFNSFADYYCYDYDDDNERRREHFKKTIFFVNQGGYESKIYIKMNQQEIDEMWEDLSS